MKFGEKIKKLIIVTIVTALVSSSAQGYVEAADEEVTQPLGTNVAYGRSIYAPNADNTISKILDGNTKSGWQAQAYITDANDRKKDPQAWVIDMQSVYTIDKIKLYWEAACATKYDVYIAETNDKNTIWTLIESVEDGVSGETTFKFTAAKARYVKLDLKYRAMDYGYHLYEAEVYTVGSTEPVETENLALKATATASSYDGNNVASNAIDGNENTIWQAPMVDDEGNDIPNEVRASENLTLQWTDAQTFNVIKIVWGGGYVSGYKFQTSEDGQTWTDICEVTDGKASETRSIKLESTVTTKWLRMQGVTFGAYRDEVRELQIFDETKIPVEKIYINTSVLRLNVDDENKLTSQMTANISPSNAVNKNVTWTSSDKTIATVDENGFVTAVKPGRTTITAASASNPAITAVCNVSVAGAIAKSTITAKKVEGTKNIKIDWTSVSTAESYKVYRIDGYNFEKKVYEGTALTYTDEALEPDTYRYYVVAVPPAENELLGNSKSEVTAGVLIPVNVTGVEVIEKSKEINVGDTAQLSIFVSPTNATNKNVLWNSDNEDVVSVDEYGKITAVSEGTAVIRVTTIDGGYSSACLVTTIPVDAELLQLNKSREVVELGKEVQLEATVLPINTTYKEITWTTTNDKVATVDDNGKVKAIGVGKAVIKASTKSGVCANYEITVKISPKSVKLSKTQITIKVGSKEVLAATINPTNATNKAVKWTSDNSAIAFVDAAGTVIAAGEGTTNIRVTTVDGNIVVICQVTVIPAEEEIAVPKKVSLKKVEKAGKNAAILIWKKVKGAIGYQIYMKSGKGKFKLIKTLKKAKKVKFTKKKLKKGKTYTFKVRAYVKRGNRKVYGKFSKVRKIKIK